MDEVAKQFGSYGPVWMLVGILMAGIGSISWAIISGLKSLANLLFSQEPITAAGPKLGQPKGLLIPWIEAHLTVFSNLESLVGLMTDAVKQNGDHSFNAKTYADQAKEHALKMEALMQQIEDRFLELERTHGDRVHSTLLVVAGMMIDNLEACGAPREMIERHRATLQRMRDNPPRG